MYVSSAIILGVMVLVYIISLRFRLSTELAMLLAALAGKPPAGPTFDQHEFKEEPAGR